MTSTTAPPPASYGATQHGGKGTLETIRLAARWGGPYAAIWAVTGEWMWQSAVHGGCWGVCAFYDDFLAYAAVTVALALSALVAVSQAAYLGRH